MTKLSVEVEVLDDPTSPRRLTFTGRMGWALVRLYRSGELGITSLEEPAPRLSHYIFRLRRAGLSIETAREPHRGDFEGVHGRYFLRSNIRVLRIEGEKAAA